MTDPIDAFTLAVRDHDRAVRDSGLNLWVGSEPTFTDRYSQAPEWLSSALGGGRIEVTQGPPCLLAASRRRACAPPSVAARTACAGDIPISRTASATMKGIDVE